MSLPYTDNLTALNAVTQTTTSSAYDFSKRQQITLIVTCAGHSSGNGVFTVNASNDGTNYANGIVVEDKSTATTTNRTYVTSKTLSANGSAALSVPAGFRYYTVTCTFTTDGTYTATFEAAG